MEIWRTIFTKIYLLLRPEFLMIGKSKESKEGMESKERKESKDFLWEFEICKFFSLFLNLFSDFLFIYLFFPFVFNNYFIFKIIASLRN